MNRLTLFLAALLSISLVLTGCKRCVQPDPIPEAEAEKRFETIESTFKNDLDGWSVIGDAADFRWNDTGGNPGGWISARDLAQGIVAYWVAPDKFLGDKSLAYGQTLAFDVFNNPATPRFSLGDKEADVIIKGGDLTLMYRFDPAAEPTSEWTSFSLDFHESDNWRTGANWANATATNKEEMLQVLSNLTELVIRAEYRQGAARTMGLDNVRITAASNSPAGTHNED